MGSLVAFQQSGFAQTITGTITGTVIDSSSLPVAGATVTLTNSGTSVKVVQKSGASGSFVFAAVLPGKYSVAVEMKGFKTVEKTDLNITAAERLSAGEFALQVGDVSQSITVDASGTPVQVNSEERSGLLTDTQMSTLEARGRDFLSLLRVMPGVVPSASGDVDSIGTRAAYPNVQGTRISYGSVSIDGVTNDDLGSSQTTPTPINMDAIGEVKVLMNNYQAEYGRTAGMLVQAVTRSGSRDLHGSGYYYKRNEEFNANNFFTNRSGGAIPRYRYNTWGGNVGGPAYIPGLLTRKDKLFFFYSEEYLPTSAPQNIVNDTMPTAAMRTGDFSGITTNILDSTTGAPFPGNIIPSTRIDPNGQKLLSVLPLPNQLNTAITHGGYNYTFQEVIPATKLNEVYRVDYNLTDKTRFYVRGLDFRLHQSGYLIGGGGTSWPELKTTNVFSDDGGASNLTHTFSPTMVNETTFGVHHSVQNIYPYDQASINSISRSALGMTLPQFYPQLNPLNLIPWASFGGVTAAPSITWDARFPTKSADTIFDFTNNLTKLWGVHTFKVGVFYERVRYFGGSSGTNSGSFAFASDANNSLDTRYAYSNALLGVFQSYQESNTRVATNGRGNELDWFLQDSWKATRRLTLDYGIRFAWYTPYSDKHNMDSSFEPNLYNPAQAPRLYYPTLVNGARVGYDKLTGATVPALLIGAFVPNTGNTANGMIQEGTAGYPSGMMNHQGILFAPRFGFAYDLFGNGKTAIRGGFGTVHNERERVLLVDIAKTPPIQYTPITYYSNFSSLLKSSGNLSPSSTAGLSITGKVPTIYNYSIGIQREIGFKTVLDVAYVGALGRHLLQERNLNTLPYGTHFLPANQDPTNPGKPLSDIFLEPYSGYSSIQEDEYASNSSFHSMQVQVNRRFARSLTLGSTWTWSKSMDYISNDYAAVAVVTPIKIWNYGKSDFDRTHIVQVNWLWDIPKATKLVKNPVVGALFDNWQLSGVASFISGAPSGISLSTTNGLDIPGGGDGVRPLVLSNPILSKSNRTMLQYFNTGVFGIPAIGTYGNAPRDVVRGPGINNFDMSIFKNIPIYHERVKGQLRFEAYNTFNHTQFSSMNTTAQFNPTTGAQVNTAFGNLTAARTARIGQIAFRVTF